MTGIGNQLRQPDPRGWLTFDYLPPELQNAEDATQGADHERSKNHPGPWARPATATERTLLAHLGYDVPAKLDTIVFHLTAGIRRRTWPRLTKPAPITDND